MTKQDKNQNPNLPTDNPFEGLLTVPELAAYLKVSLSSVYRYSKRNNFPKGLKILGSLRFDAEEVKEYIRVIRTGRTYSQKEYERKLKK